MIAIFFIALLSITHSQGITGFWNNTPWNKLPADSGIKKICTQKLSEEEENVYQRELSNTCECLKNFVLGQKIVAEKQVDGLPDFTEEIKLSTNPFMKNFLIDQQINMYINAIALTSILTASDPEKQKAFLWLLTPHRLQGDKEILTKEYLNNH